MPPRISLEACQFDEEGRPQASGAWPGGGAGQGAGRGSVGDLWARQPTQVTGQGATWRAPVCPPRSVAAPVGDAWGGVSQAWSLGVRTTPSSAPALRCHLDSGFGPFSLVKVSGRRKCCGMGRAGHPVGTQQAGAVPAFCYFSVSPRPALSAPALLPGSLASSQL